MASHYNQKLPGVVFLVASFLAGVALTAILFLTFHHPGMNQEADRGQLQSSVSDDSANDLANSDVSHVSEGSVVDGEGLPSFSALAQFKSEFSTNLALYNYVAQVGKERLLELVSESRQLEPNIQLNTQRVIFERLASVDPKLALSQAENLAPSLTTTVFIEWSRKDLNEAIANAKSLDKTRQDAALRAILISRSDLPDEYRLEIGKQFDNEELAQSTINSSKLGEYLKSPGESWNEIVGVAQHDPLQIGLLHTLAQNWFEQEGLDVLDHISASLTNERARDSILGSVVHRSTKSNPQDTLERALRIASDIDNKIVWDVTHQWARSDPESAFYAISALDRTRLQRELLNLVLQTWAEDDTESMVAKLDQLPDDLYVLGLEFALNAISRETPQRAVALISQIEDTRKKSNAVYTVALRWSRQDPSAALNWLLNDLEVEQFREQVLGTVLASLAESNSQLAFETALAQSTEADKPGLEAMVITHLAYSDVDEALALLPRVREGLTKLAAYGSVGMAFVENGNAMDAMDLATQLPESDREGYYLMTTMTWAEQDPEGLLDTIDEISSPVAKSKAAAVLTFMNRFANSLTSEQIDDVKKYLSEEDAKILEEGGAGLFNPIMNLGLGLM